MSQYGTHRNCRAAKKKAEICHEHDIYITKRQMRKIICAASCTMIIVYLKGIIEGYMMCRAHDNKDCMM